MLEPFYKGGDYDFLLNSDRELDLTNRRFIVFELDNISGNKVLLPVVTLIIMGDLHRQDAPSERNPQGNIDRGVLESPYVRQHERLYQYLFKTVRKYFGEAVVVTQEVDDIISSPDCEGRPSSTTPTARSFGPAEIHEQVPEHIQRLLGLTEKEKSQILSINQANHPDVFTVKSG